MENGEMWDSVNLKVLSVYGQPTLLKYDSNVWKYVWRNVWIGLEDMISFKHLISDELENGLIGEFLAAENF
jgi:hypothetical protein